MYFKQLVLCAVKLFIDLEINQPTNELTIKKYNIMKKFKFFFILLAFPFFIHSCAVYGQPGYYVSIRPSRSYYAPLPPPSRGFIWIEGDYVWNGGGYVWRNGYWAAPRHRNRYNPGYWVSSNRGYYWAPGRWSRF